MKILGNGNMSEKVNYWLVLVCEHFSIDKATLLGREQHRLAADARKVAMWLLYFKVRLTYKLIGDIFDGRDHSTAMYNVNNINVSDVNAVMDLVERKRQQEMPLDVE